ncbi:MAG: TRAP transporter small permease [Alcanivorax sp.]|nr:TRAP transporter small permease [Alcanivorax sp.]
MTNARRLFAHVKRADDQLVRLERALIFGRMIFLVIILTVQVLSRYVFNAPLDYTEEASRFGLIWLVFIGSAYAAYLNEHFVVRLLVDNVKFPGKSAYLVFIDVAVIVFFVALIYYGAKLAWKNPRVEPALNLSMGWAYLAIPVGCSLMVFHLLVALVRVRVFGEETYAKYESDYDRIPDQDDGTRTEGGDR